MMVLYQVHGELACVLNYLPADTVTRKCLLEQYITTVLLICQDAPKYRSHPCGTACRIGNMFTLQLTLDHTEAHP